MLPPLPPRVKEGRMMDGNPVSFTISQAVSRSVAYPLGATLRPMRAIASLNRCRSSALRIVTTSAPISSTPNRSSTPLSASARAVLSPVWPPIVGNRASGLSRSMIFSTTPGVTGST